MIKKTVTALSLAVLSASIGTLPIATSFAGTPGQVSAGDSRTALNPCAAVNPVPPRIRVLGSTLVPQQILAQRLIPVPRPILAAQSIPVPVRTHARLGTDKSF